MRQHGTPLCKHPRGAGTERRDRRCVAKPEVGQRPLAAQPAPQVGFEVDGQLIFGRFPDRALGVRDAALIEAFKGGGVDMPDRGSYCGPAETSILLNVAAPRPFVR